jgi:hypothetical protein
MSLIEGAKPVKTIPFSGKRDEYFMWTIKFLSYCHMHGCKKILMGEEQVPPHDEEIDETGVEGKKKLRI